MTAFVYSLLDPRDGTVRYIGQSATGLSRIKEHWAPSRLAKERTRCRNWIMQLLSLGLKPEYRIVEVCAVDALDETEMRWIAHCRAVGYDLLNHTDGGKGRRGYAHTEATKALIAARAKGRRPSAEALFHMSLASRRPENIEHCRHMAHLPRKPMTAKQRQRYSDARRGKRFSKEACIAMSTAHGGRPFYDQHGTKYESQAIAARQLGLSQGHISRVLHGLRRHAGGYRFTLSMPKECR